MDTIVRSRPVIGSRDWALRLNEKLAGHDLPLEGPVVTDAFGLMSALVVGATKDGYCYASVRLVARYIWWQIDTINIRKLQSWIDDLEAWGEITIEPLAASAYAPWGHVNVIVIQNKTRFRRWRARPPFTAAQRVEVYGRDNGACVHCGATESLSIDHIVPWSKGGEHELWNFQTLCRSCNSKKGARIDA